MTVHAPRCQVHACKFGVARFGAVALLAGTTLFAPGMASALPITIDFSGSGVVSGPPQVFPQLLGLTMSSATSSYVVDGENDWHVDKDFNFNVATLTGGGSFTLSNGLSSLSGTFTSSRADSVSPTDLLYTVTTGTGSFAGFTGSGVARGGTAGNPFALPASVVTFSERGVFTLQAVPEPATLWLLGAALAGCLWRAQRRGTGAAVRAA